MPNVRVIKRNDGVIQVQHRPDEVYTDATLPSGTAPADVAASVIVDASQLAGITDTQVQLDIVNDALTKDLTQKSVRQELRERQTAAETVLAGLEADAAVPEDVKRYFRAICDWVNAGPNKVSRPQTPSTGRS